MTNPWISAGLKFPDLSGHLFYERIGVPIAKTKEKDGADLEPIIDIPGGSYDGFDEYEAVEIMRDDHVITTEYMVVSVS